MHGLDVMEYGLKRIASLTWRMVLSRLFARCCDTCVQVVRHSLRESEKVSIAQSKSRSNYLPSKGSSKPYVCYRVANAPPAQVIALPDISTRWRSLKCFISANTIIKATVC